MSALPGLLRQRLKVLSIVEHEAAIATILRKCALSLAVKLWHPGPQLSS
jgi:hypothetical protein